MTAAAGDIRVHGRNYSDWFRKDAGRDARYELRGYAYAQQDAAAAA